MNGQSEIEGTVCISETIFQRIMDCDIELQNKFQRINLKHSNAGSVYFEVKTSSPPPFLAQKLPQGRN